MVVQSSSVLKGGLRTQLDSTWGYSHSIFHITPYIDCTTIFWGIHIRALYWPHQDPNQSYWWSSKYLDLLMIRVMGCCQTLFLSGASAVGSRETQRISWSTVPVACLFLSFRLSFVLPFFLLFVCLFSFISKGGSTCIFVCEQLRPLRSAHLWLLTVSVALTGIHTRSRWSSWCVQSWVQTCLSLCSLSSPLLTYLLLGEELRILFFSFLPS